MTEREAAGRRASPPCRAHPGRAAAVSLVLALLAAAGCSTDAPPEAATQAGETRSPTTEPQPPTHATVLQPGRPGEPARTLGPDATVPGSRWNRADAEFVQMMIPHHAQALEMCALARTRADNSQVAALARRIEAAQGPEILAMSAWLQERGLEVPPAGHPTGHATGPGGGHGHGAHGHGDPGDHGSAPMPGMLTDAQMRALGAARGARFDRLFLTGMVAHHRGAVAMASRVQRRGGDLRVSEIANDVAAEQSAEIARMRDLLRRL